MKQPKVDIDTYCQFRERWLVSVDDESDYVNIALAKTKQGVLRAAIRRLERLKRDCERELAEIDK